jgi:hypothetical protein
MFAKSDDRQIYSRVPTIDDLVKICKSLNENDFKYIVINGMVIINAGYARATEDIDLLIEPSSEN